MYTLTVEKQSVNLDTLTQQIISCTNWGGIQILYLNSDSTNVSVVLSDTPNQTQIDAVNSTIANHNSIDVKNIIRSAILFGQELTLDFAAENVAMGITQAGKTKLIADTCQSAFYYLSTGSLYEARTEMLDLTITEPMSPFLTHARRLAFVNKIEQYLGIPLSE